MAIFARRRDQTGLWGTLQVCVGLSTLLSVITGTVLFALAYPISIQVFKKPELAPLLQITSTIIPFLVLSEVLAGATRGFQKMHHMVIAQNIVQPIIRLVLIVILSLVGISPAWAIIIFGLANGAASILFLFFLNKQFPLKQSISVSSRDTRTVLSYSLPLWLSNLMVTFRGNAQTLLLGSLNTITGVGVYSVVDQVNQVGQMLFNSITTSARPMIAEIHDQGDNEQMGRLYQTTTKWIVMINLPVFLIMMLYPVPILTIFGKSFVNGAEAMIILALANLVDIGTGMCGAIVEMTGYTKLRLLNTFIRLIASLGLNFMLIPIWGILGAAISTLLVEIVINLLILLEVWFLFRLIPYNRHFFNPLIAGLAAFATGLTVNYLLPFQEKTIYVLFSLVAMLAVYVAVNLSLGLAPEDRLLVSRLHQRFGTLFG